MLLDDSGEGPAKRARSSPAGIAEDVQRAQQRVERDIFAMADPRKRSADARRLAEWDAPTRWRRFSACHLRVRPLLPSNLLSQFLMMIICLSRIVADWHPDAAYALQGRQGVSGWPSFRCTACNGRASL
jgi:hypothetical protein